MMIKSIVGIVIKLRNILSLKKILSVDIMESITLSVIFCIIWFLFSFIHAGYEDLQKNRYINKSCQDSIIKIESTLTKIDNRLFVLETNLSKNDEAVSHFQKSITKAFDILNDLRSDKRDIEMLYKLLLNKPGI